MREGARVLDADCGSGIVTRHLARTYPGCEVIGCDASELRVQQAKSLSAGAPRLRFDYADLGRLEYPDGHFDLIICRYVFQHLPAATRAAALAGFRRCLAPGGKLVVIDFDGPLYNVHPRSPWLRGFSDSPMVPVSRYNDIDRQSLGPDLEILIDNAEIGVCMLDDPKHRAVHMLNHLEYDNRSLADEYERDVKAGLDTRPPVNLFPNGDTTAEPENRWRSHAHLLFQNWINEIYQTTPYDTGRIGEA